MNIDQKKTAFFIDGSSFLYRAYYGLRPLHTSKGIAVQAVYSFCRMMKKLIDTFGIEYVAIVWDSKGKTERHEMYEAYKATRQAPPSDLFVQKEYIVRFADLIGMKQVAQQGIEADDIMYSLAVERVEEGDMAVLVTLDKDMRQTLEEKIVIYDPMKDRFIDADLFCKEHGFAVDKIPFFFALVGDASDNIPGVVGIGQKTAEDLVKRFDSLDDLYARLDAVEKPKIKNALQTHKDDAFLSRDLFLLRYHASGVSREELYFDASKWALARPLFQELEFKSLLQEIAPETREEDPVKAKIAYWQQFDFKTVTTQQELDDLCAYLVKHDVWAIDTETTGLDPLQAGLVGISICAEPTSTYYIPCGHINGNEQLLCATIVKALKPLFENPAYKKYMHHAKFDLLVLYAQGIDVQNVIMDTMIVARLIIPDWQRPGLKHLSTVYFDESMLSYEDVVKHQGYKSFAQVPLNIARLYACADARQTMRLAQKVGEDIDREGLAQLYQTIEHPLIFVLYDMERRGICFDAQALTGLATQVTQDIATIETEVRALVGQDMQDINLNSPRQVEQLLFYHLKLPPQKKSGKSQNYSTDQQVLTTLSGMHPVPGLILKYRELAKLKSTYIDALPTYVNKKTGRIHTTFSQTNVATGRLSSSDPNLQNIPASGPGLGIRAAFKPDPGHVFISADYSQIELRVLAYLSQDERLMQAFLDNVDIHKETASRLFDVPLDEVNHAQRQLGKRINFSILYGLTPYGLSQELDISFKDAKHYIEKYFQQYPKVSGWMESVIESAKNNGYVQTVWGRRRYVPAIHEHNKSLYEEARRVAINTVAQGTAADIMKLGMIRLVEALRAQSIDGRIVLQIHDELLFTVVHSQLNHAQTIIKQILESVTSWPVPLVVTTRSGDTWQEVSK